MAQYPNALPTDWDGKFPFTNDSEEDFVFMWGKKNYLFPARRTVDLMRMNFNSTPLEVQQIRKNAAKKWAEREFLKSVKAQQLTTVERNTDGSPRLMSFHNARSYSEADLKDDIMRCLTPLPEGKAEISEALAVDMEKIIHHDTDTNEPITAPIKNQTQSVNQKPGYVLVN